MAFAVDHVSIDASIATVGNTNGYTCRLWYALTGTEPVVGTLDTYTNEIMEWMVTEWAATLSTNCVFNGLKARWQIGANEYYVWSSDAPVAGTVSGTENLPEHDAVILRKYTGQSDRENRGRLFLPMIPEAFQVQSRLTTGAATAYQALANVLKAPPEGTDIDGDGVVLEPRHANFKDNQLIPIINWALVLDVHTRRDRRNPRASAVLGVP